MEINRTADSRARENISMDASELTAAADSLAETMAGVDTGDLEVTRQGRAFLAGAEAALRATAEAEPSK